MSEELSIESHSSRHEVLGNRRSLGLTGERNVTSGQLSQRQLTDAGSLESLFLESQSLESQRGSTNSQGRPSIPQSSVQVATQSGLRAFNLSSALGEFRKQERQVAMARFLAGYGVPLDQWDRGDAKGLAKFCEEVASGELRLTVHNGVVHLASNVVIFKVLARDTNYEPWKLIEGRQVFLADGRERYRTTMGGCPGEKMKPGEQVKHAVQRGLLEELGVRHIVSIETESHCSRIQPSVNYPGTIECQEFYFNLVSVEGREIVRLQHGHVERTETMETHFAWVPFQYNPSRSGPPHRNSIPTFMPLIAGEPGVGRRAQFSERLRSI